MMNLLNSIVISDNKFQAAVMSIRNSSLNEFFLIFTYLGYWATITVMFAGVSWLLYLNKKTALILPFFVAVLGSGLMTLAVKFLVNRARPSLDAALYVEQLPSFPSAHAAMILAFFGFLIFCLWKFNFSWEIKASLSALFILIIALIGFSRVYLGVHFVSDVIGGYLIGLIWLLVGIFLI
jgi:undecaprenyl-diphosphatase